MDRYSNNTLTCKTPSGGYHYVYKLTPLQRRRFALWKGSSELKLFDLDIDVLYNTGRFVMYGSYYQDNKIKNYRITNYSLPIELPEIVFQEIVNKIPSDALINFDFLGGKLIDIHNKHKCIGCNRDVPYSYGMHDAWGMGCNKFICSYCYCLVDNSNVVNNKKLIKFDHEKLKEYSEMEFDSSSQTSTVAAGPVLDIDDDEVKVIDQESINNNDNILLQYLDCLKSFRCSERKEWFRIGGIIHNCNGSFELFNKWSQKCKSKYELKGCENVWKIYSKKTNKKAGFPKLKELAKEDNPKLFMSISITQLPINITNIYKDFISAKNADDKSMGNLFYNIYPNEYIYDAANCVWYSLNKYGIYELEGSELLSARTKIRDELYPYFVKEIMSQIKNPENALEKENLIKFSCVFHKKISSVNQRKLIIEDIKEKYKLSGFRGKCNNNKYIFAFNNGVFDLKTFKFRNAYPDEIVTDTCGYDYSPSTKDTRDQVIKMIENIFVDKDLFTYVMQVLSMRLVRINTLEEFYFLIGPGGNGKGLLTSLIENTFGTFSQVLAPETFMKTKHGVHAEAANPGIASTYNSLIVFCCETGKAMKITAELLKRLSGNDKIKARFLREDFFEFIPGYAIFFVSNYEPIVDGADEGIQRRCRYIPFLVKMKNDPDPNNKYERKKDNTLKEKIKNPEFKCAFFDILREYYKNIVDNNITDLIPPECVIKKTRQYLNENDPIKLFIEQMVEITKNEKQTVLSSDLYDKYLNFNEGISRGYDRPKFKKRLGELGINDKHTKYGTAFCGIVCKDIVEV